MKKSVRDLLYTILIIGIIFAVFLGLSLTTFFAVSILIVGTYISQYLAGEKK
jgi:ABC-type protease/lipase transport system fused ATPase/permease subunit